jgi:hypothetical protein
MQIISDGTRNLKIILKIVSGEPSGSQDGFAVKSAYFERLKASIHCIVGRRLSSVSLANEMDCGQAERRNGAIERPFIAQLPKASRIMYKRLSIQEHVKHNVGIDGEFALSVLLSATLSNPLSNHRIIRRYRCSAGNPQCPLKCPSRCRLARLFSHVAQDFVGQCYSLFHWPRRDLGENRFDFQLVSHNGDFSIIAHAPPAKVPE